MEYKCKDCMDSGFVGGGMPWPVVERKATERACWKDLTTRIRKEACAKCHSAGDEVAATMTSAAADPPVRKKRKYTKRSPRWSRKS